MPIPRETPLEEINFAPYSTNKAHSSVVMRMLWHPAIKARTYGDLIDSAQKEKALEQFNKIHSSRLNRLVAFLEIQRDDGDNSVMPLLSALTHIQQEREERKAQEIGHTIQKKIDAGNSSILQVVAAIAERQEEKDTGASPTSHSFSLTDPKGRSAEDQLTLAKSGVPAGQEKEAERLYNQGAYVLVTPTAHTQKSLKDAAPAKEQQPFMRS